MTKHSGTQKYKVNINRYKGRNYSNTIVGEFNIPLTSMEKSYRQKTNKETVVLTLDQLDLLYTLLACDMSAIVW